MLVEWIKPSKSLSGRHVCSLSSEFIHFFSKNTLLLSRPSIILLTCTTQILYMSFLPRELIPKQIEARHVSCLCISKLNVSNKQMEAWSSSNHALSVLLLNDLLKGPQIPHLSYCQLMGEADKPPYSMLLPHNWGTHSHHYVDSPSHPPDPIF